MKVFRATSKKRVLISSGVGGVVGLIAWLLFRLYLHSVAYESTQPDPERDAAMQTAAQALSGGAASSPSTQITPTAPATAHAAVPELGSAAADNPTSASAASTSPSSDGATSDNSPQTHGLSTTPTNGLPPDDPKAVWALQNAGAAAPDGGAIDTITFPFATSSGVKSHDGYPIYLIECNVGSHQCVGETGQPIGSATQIANTITPVRNADALRYHCPDWICIDSQGNVVGSVAPAMRPYLTRAH